MARTKKMEIELFIEKDKEGLYFDQPFEVPGGVERIDIKYSYTRFITTSHEGADVISQVNIIDLALASNKGEFIGSSGSNRGHIWVSEHYASDGYAPVEIGEGTWNIIVGAYKVQESGVKVTYEILLTFKERTLLKGDCHMHTTGSDGILSIDELSLLARKNKLDFLFITDHNNYAHNYTLKSSESLTLIPGVEWTHFDGHANLLGVKRPFKGKYYANTTEEVRAILSEARDNGAIVSINHPFDANCPWKWGLENFEFDCVEIWNGIIKSSDMQCIAWWHQELCKGRRLPVIAGSDFHRFHNFGMIGTPTTWVYSMSRGESDILRAIREGHTFMTFQAEAPRADISCGDYFMGDAVPFENGLRVTIEFKQVNMGDTIKIYSAAGTEKEISVQKPGSLKLEITAENKRFYRAELYRQLLPNLPQMLYLITNPIYFK